MKTASETILDLEQTIADLRAKLKDAALRTDRLREERDDARIALRESAQGTPEPPKVEELARLMYEANGSPSGPWEMFDKERRGYAKAGWLLNANVAIEALRPYFPPASQTPEKITNDLCEIGRRVLDCLEEHRCPDGAIDEIEASMANLDRVIRKLRSSESATPASTARTDALSKLLEVLGAIESVSGDDFCADLEMRNANRKLHGALATAYEKLGQIYRLSHGFNTQNSCHYVHTNWREELKKFAAPGRVPQAEPPKEEKQ